MWKFFLLISITTTLILVFFFDFYQVSGNSMAPLYKDGSIVLVSRKTGNLRKPVKGDIIIFKNPVTGGVNIKKCRYVDGEEVFVTGLNLNESTDSRHFGRISTDEIMGWVWIKI